VVYVLRASTGQNQMGNGAEMGRQAPLPLHFHIELHCLCLLLQGLFGFIPASMKILLTTLFATLSLVVTSVVLLIVSTTEFRNVYFGVVFFWVAELIPLLLLLVITRLQKKKVKGSAFYLASATSLPGHPLCACSV
jgi:hypothetical protein